MNLFEAALIALVEGLTEFLPVSSTAHMKFLNPFIGVENDAFSNMFEIVIQLAAILAVVVIYRKKFLNFKKISFYIKLIIAVIPALIFGVLLKKHIDAALSNLTFMATVMLVGGIVLLFVDRLFTNPTIDSEDKISSKNALVIGCFQVLSILFPGLSRSAATILGGMSQKLSRQAAAEFSFFLAVPTMFAATVKSIYDVMKNDAIVINESSGLLLLAGSVIAFVVALLSIRGFIDLLKRSGFKWFGVYRIVLGITVLILLKAGIMH